MILRSEIYDVDLGVPIGHEPSVLRPGVVVTADLINNRPGGLIGIVPITSARYGLRSHVELEKGPSGLSYESFARCDQIRMLSIQRLKSQRGHVPIQAMDEIDRALRFILGL